MEKTTTETITTTRTTHHFYCDRCGIHIGSSGEYADGYYPEVGDFELKIYMPRGWYELHKCFCDECREEFLNEFYNTLENAGFEPDKY